MPWFKPLLNVSWKSLCRRIYTIKGETYSILFFKALRPPYFHAINKKIHFCFRLRCNLQLWSTAMCWWNHNTHREEEGWEIDPWLGFVPSAISWKFSGWRDVETTTYTSLVRRTKERQVYWCEKEKKTLSIGTHFFCRSHNWKKGNTKEIILLKTEIKEIEWN